MAAVCEDRQFLICHASQTVSFTSSSGHLREDVTKFAEEKFGIPVEEQKFISQGETLKDEWDSLLKSPAAAFTILTLSRVLLGGKGGFGALIRNEVTKRKKVTNFDACRDLDGRRLRHSKAAERIKEWAQKQAEEDALVAQLAPDKNEKKKDKTADVTLDEDYLRQVDEIKLDNVVSMGMKEREKKNKLEQKLEKEMQKKAEAQASKLDKMMGLEMSSDSEGSSSEEGSEEEQTTAAASSSTGVINLA